MATPQHQPAYARQAILQNIHIITNTIIIVLSKKDVTLQKMFSSYLVNYKSTRLVNIPLMIYDAF